MRRAPPLAGLFLVNQSRTSMHCCTLLLVASHARLTVHARVLRHRCSLSLSNQMLSPAPNPLCSKRVTTCYWPLHACCNVCNVGESSPFFPCMSAFITQQPSEASTTTRDSWMCTVIQSNPPLWQRSLNLDSSSCEETRLGANSITSITSTHAAQERKSTRVSS